MGRYIANTNSYQDNELLLLKQGFAKNRKEFLTAGANTWAIDHDVIVRVRVWGGGGGGGGGYDRSTGGATSLYYTPGGGGGAGGAAEAILRLKAGTYNITVGAGGTAGNGSEPSVPGFSPVLGTNGGNGGSSSFHTYITCSGGFGGSKSDGLYGAVLGGVGGAATFNQSGSDGFLYMGSQFGGAGGFCRFIYQIKFTETNDVKYSNLVGCDLEGGAGESGGFAGVALSNYTGALMGGGGGGYNAPFIYVTDMSVQANSGRGVGAGGAGGQGSSDQDSRSGFAGNSGAVVIEWN